MKKKAKQQHIIHQMCLFWESVPFVSPLFVIRTLFCMCTRPLKRHKSPRLSTVEQLSLNSSYKVTKKSSRNHFLLLLFLCCLFSLDNFLYGLSFQWIISSKEGTIILLHAPILLYLLSELWKMWQYKTINVFSVYNVLCLFSDRKNNGKK